MKNINEFEKHKRLKLMYLFYISFIKRSALTGLILLANHKSKFPFTSATKALLLKKMHYLTFNVKDFIRFRCIDPCLSQSFNATMNVCAILDFLTYSKHSRSISNYQDSHSLKVVFIKTSNICMKGINFAF